MDHTHQPPKSQHLRKGGNKPYLSRLISILLLVGCLGAGFLTYYAFSQENFLTHHRGYVLWILNLDLMLLLAFGVLIARHLVKLWAAHRAGRAGSRLHVTFVGLFGILTLVPTVTVTLLSGIFFNQGLQSWFGDRVRTALQQSTKVAEAYLNEHKKVISASAEAMARDIASQYQDFLMNRAAFDDALEAYCQVRGLDEAIVFDLNGIVAKSRLSFSLQFERITQQMMLDAQQEPLILEASGGDRVRALVKIGPEVDVYLLVGRFVDPRVQERILQVENAVSEYNILENQRGDLELKFLLIFIVFSLLLMLGALWAGLITASRLARPIINLIEGAEAVRAGQLDIQLAETTGKDELSLLLRAFNRMTRQLGSQRQDLLEANNQLNLRRQMLEGILEGVKAGVVGVDDKGIIRLTNRSAEEMLSLLPGEPLGVVVPEANSILKEARLKKEHFFQDHITLSRKGFVRTYLIRLVLNPHEGAIITFDDITDLVSAQRNAAWRDVAKRIAHEIKNPLTPIQLSADRLRRRYHKLIPPDDKAFDTCVGTIVRHVELIGQIVNEFSAFARMPTPKIAVENLSALAEQAIFLQQSAHPTISFPFISEPSIIKIKCDANQMQQVLTNLLQNAIDAVMARAVKEKDYIPEVGVCFKADSSELVLEVYDNGEGFPARDQEKLFEPYITHKVKGTGLGLAIVKKIIEDHNGSIRLQNRPQGGASVLINFSSSMVVWDSTPNEKIA